jgi:hypothetical protein
MPASAIEQQTSTLIPSSARSVQADINYSVDLPTTGNEKWFIDINNRGNKNFGSINTPTTIYDVRGQEVSTHIDTTGFQALTAPSSVSSDFLLTASTEEIERIYYPEVEALIKKQTGASRVVFFDHTIRRPINGVYFVFVCCGNESKLTFIFFCSIC